MIFKVCKNRMFVETGASFRTSLNHRENMYVHVLNLRNINLVNEGINQGAKVVIEGIKTKQM